MKTKYNQPIVEVIGLKPSCVLLAGSPGATPSWSGSPIEDNGVQEDAR